MNKREITKFRKSYVPWSFERFKLTSEVTLAISFDEKDEIRSRFNARWDPDEKVWWMKTGIAEEDFGYLNDLKALYCPRAIVCVDAVEKAIIDVESIGHKIYCANTGHQRVFDHYPSIQITRIALSPDSDHPATMWVDEQTARYLWKTYMDEGYRRCYTVQASPEEIEQIR
jgi:hypothetical protein